MSTGQRITGAIVDEQLDAGQGDDLVAGPDGLMWPREVVEAIDRKVAADLDAAVARLRHDDDTARLRGLFATPAPPPPVEGLVEQRVGRAHCGCEDHRSSSFSRRVYRRGDVL